MQELYLHLLMFNAQLGVLFLEIFDVRDELLRVRAVLQHFDVPVYDLQLVVQLNYPVLGFQELSALRITCLLLNLQLFFGAYGIHESSLVEDLLDGQASLDGLFIGLSFTDLRYEAVIEFQRRGFEKGERGLQARCLLCSFQFLVHKHVLQVLKLATVRGRRFSLLKEGSYQSVVLGCQLFGHNLSLLVNKLLRLLKDDWLQISNQSVIGVLHFFDSREQEHFNIVCDRVSAHTHATRARGRSEL